MPFLNVSAKQAQDLAKATKRILGMPVGNANVTRREIQEDGGGGSPIYVVYLKKTIDAGAIDGEGYVLDGFGGDIPEPEEQEEKTVEVRNHLKYKIRGGERVFCLRTGDHYDIFWTIGEPLDVVVDMVCEGAKAKLIYKTVYVPSMVENTLTDPDDAAGTAENSMPGDGSGSDDIFDGEADQSGGNDE